MYHEVTHKTISRRRRHRAIVTVVVAALVALTLFTYGVARTTLRAQGASSLRESIMSAARQCAAVEGSYPSSLAHLEEHYGLSVNDVDYVITYDWFADNVMPTVVVVPR